MLNICLDIWTNLCGVKDMGRPHIWPGEILIEHIASKYPV